MINEIEENRYWAADLFEIPYDNWCLICHAPKKPAKNFSEHSDELCNCIGLQPYTLSSYPGEYKLVKTLPRNNTEQQYYKRTDVDELVN